MKTAKNKINCITILAFTEKNDLAVLESRFCKVDDIFYIGKNKFIRISPLWVIGEDESGRIFVKW